MSITYALQHFLDRLTKLRLSHGCYYNLENCKGFLDALFLSGSITIDQWEYLFELMHSAFDNSRKNFPIASNAGPVMPSYISLGRSA